MVSAVHLNRFPFVLKKSVSKRIAMIARRFVNCSRDIVVLTCKKPPSRRIDDIGSDKEKGGRVANDRLAR